MDTKACSLTEDEIKTLIKSHGFNLNNKFDESRIERINYLNRRLKAFNEADKAEETKTEGMPAVKAGW